METLSISDTRANRRRWSTAWSPTRRAIAITRQKGEGVVMVSASEWASIEETLYLLQSPKNAARLLEPFAASKRVTATSTN